MERPNAEGQPLGYTIPRARKLRILHVVPTYLPAWRYGGPIRSVHGLAKAQAGSGDEVTVFTTNRDGPDRLPVATNVDVMRDGVAVRYFPASAPGRLGVSRELGAAVRREIRKFDLAHLHSVFQYPTLVASRAAARQGVPYFVSPRGMLVPELVNQRGELRKRLWIHFFDRETLRRAHAIVASSDTEAGDIQRMGLAVAPISVIPNGFDPDDEAEGPPGALRAEAHLRAQGPLLVYLGRLSWKKGLDRLVRALEKIDGAHLAIAGNDDEELWPSLLALAKDLGVSDRVTYLGEVRGRAKRELLALARVFVLPSISENFGIAVLEAMGAAVPVVVTRGVGLASEISASRCGLVTGDASEAIAEAVRKLLSEPEEAAAMGQRGRDLALGSYSWPAVSEAMRLVYLRALGT